MITLSKKKKEEKSWLVTPEMRAIHFNMTGTYSTDREIMIWHKKDMQ